MHDSTPRPQATFDVLPFEVKTIILRYVVNDILRDLRRPSPNIPYTVRLRQWLYLRLVSKSFERILSVIRFEGKPIEFFLKAKQLEKLDYILEAMQVTADLLPLSSRLSVPRLKRLCGKFWFNPDLEADAVETVASLMHSTQSINFMVKLEQWIHRNRTRSESDGATSDGVLFFEKGDWIVNAGDLRIKRVSRFQTTAGSKIGIYLTREFGHHLSDVHLRLGHDRRWYMEYDNGVGRPSLKCMVNYKTRMVWDNLQQKLYDFEGRQYEFQGMESEEDEMYSNSGGY